MYINLYAIFYQTRNLQILKISEDDIFAKYFLPLCFVCAKKFYGKIIAVVEIKQIDL
jgi:hypothetical protein